MEILVTGAAGQLGRELCRQLGPAAVPIDVDTLDLTDGPAVLATMDRLAPGAVINCAAYTQVDRAQREPERCRAVNATAVEHLARACRRLDIPLMQISTDYVFGGPGDAPRPWRETDPAEPQGVYAASKLEGEQAAATAPKHLIVRTCGLYARPAHAGAQNFVTTILRLAASRPVLRVVNDQHCTPSYVPHVARAFLFLLGVSLSPPAEKGSLLPAPSSPLVPPSPPAPLPRGERGVGEKGDSPHLPERPSGCFAQMGTVPFFPAAWGTYHVTNAGATTWYEFAREIVRLAGLSVPVEPISTAEFAAAAPRPAYSVLDTTAYQRLGGPPLPDWRTALAEYFAERQTP
jgi:dTDP-4-dehydrorhamnose reductase